MVRSCGCSLCAAQVRFGAAVVPGKTIYYPAAALARPLAPNYGRHGSSVEALLVRSQVLIYDYVSSNGNYNYTGYRYIDDYKRWNGHQRLGTATVVTYSVAGNLGTTFKTSIAQAFTDWARVANISFRRVSSGGDIHVMTKSLSAGIAGQAYYPSTNINSYNGAYRLDDRYQSRVELNTRYFAASGSGTSKGTYNYLTILHEIGHAIGLKHPGNYNAGGGGAGGPYLARSLDNQLNTVMSYYDASAQDGSATTPMRFDIAAIQSLYGKNLRTNAGNNAYVFSGKPAYQCIWDAGGTDTFNFSRQTGTTTINLNPDSFSSVSSRRNAVSIAAGVMIEIAHGGSGADTIYGNIAANSIFGGGGNDRITAGNGNDIVRGDAGNDVLNGGAGIDTALFAGRYRDYRLRQSGRNYIVTSARYGTDTLIGIEKAKFSDRTITLRT